MTVSGASIAIIALVPLQFAGTAREVLILGGRIGGLAVLSAAVAGAVAVLYRWYTRDRIPNPPAVLLGIATIALYLNARTALGDVMGESATLSAEVALFNVGALLVGTVSATIGVAGGDRLARSVQETSHHVAVDDSVGRLVRTVGRVVTVELPTDIEDVPGYDPVDSATRMALEGKTLVFPRGLSDEELRERVERRIREDYRVGHVDVEFEADGTVNYLGLGRRAAGIGPTLPPESAAMAIRADPAHAASAGDLVQVWSRNPQQRLLNAEVRGTAGEVVTIAMDAADASKLDPESRYKLVTLPVEERADRELTELLRAAPETFGVVEIDDGSELTGMPIAALDVTVVAVHAGGPDDRVETLPPGDRRLDAGESIYVVARPEVIRRIESAANADGTSPAAASGTIARRDLEPVSADTDSDEPLPTENTGDASGAAGETEDSANQSENDQPERTETAERDEQDRASQSAENSDERPNDDRNSSGAFAGVESGTEGSAANTEKSGSGDETNGSAPGGRKPKDESVDEPDVAEESDEGRQSDDNEMKTTQESSTDSGFDRERRLGDAQERDNQSEDDLEKGDDDEEHTVAGLDSSDGDGNDAGDQRKIPIDDIDVESLEDLDIEDIDVHSFDETGSSESDEDTR